MGLLCIDRGLNAVNDKLDKLLDSADRRVESLNDLQEAQTRLSVARMKARTVENLVQAVVDASPDMLWAKDLGPNPKTDPGIGGRFLFTNSMLREKLLMSPTMEDALGKSDIFFALRDRSIHGDRSFTFGDLSGNSDALTLRENEGRGPGTGVPVIPCYFLESGLVRNKNLRLMVVKYPFYSHEGILIGTVGAGRDMTDSYKNLEAIRALWDNGRAHDLCASSKSCSMAAEALVEYMEEFIFLRNSGIETVKSYGRG